MLNKDGVRELAYLVYVDEIVPMDADRLECARVGGWNCVVGKGEFKKGDIGVYFEIDSKLPEVAPFSEMEFLKSKHYAIKSQKIRKVVSQGLLMPVSAFGWTVDSAQFCGGIEFVVDEKGNQHFVEDESRFLTTLLGVTYNRTEDQVRKSKPGKGAKFLSAMAHHPKFAKSRIGRWLAKRAWGRKLIETFLYSKKAQSARDWPVGRFPGVAKTDQERVENMPWVLSDKTPFIRTQKCDGSSGTYILERNKRGYEFYVCSRNVRFQSKDDESYYGAHNYYWEVAEKYDIESKMKDYLEKNPDITFVCWQGEICAPAIQSNPHGLTETHFYCFHMTDSKTGRFDVREAAKIWKSYGMEVVPIDEELYVLPDDFEEFKATADGTYDPVVCEGKKGLAREGYVYYKSTDPTFSFKNVSRKYLLKRGE